MTKPVNINRATNVSLGLLFTIIGLLCMGTWMSAQWVRCIETEIQLLRADVSTAISDRWTQDDMVHWTLDLRDKNKAIDVPSPGRGR